MAVLESNLRRIFRDESKFSFGTVSFCEFAKGADAGLPDCWIADSAIKAHRGLELKLGSSVLKALRPSQMLWHKSSGYLGIPTFGISISFDGSVLHCFRLEMKTQGVLSEEEIAVIKPDELDYRFLINDLFE